jgi:hypothetical protein
VPFIGVLNSIEEIGHGLSLLLAEIQFWFIDDPVPAVLVATWAGHGVV